MTPLWGQASPTPQLSRSLPHKFLRPPGPFFEIWALPILAHTPRPRVIMSSPLQAPQLAISGSPKTLHLQRLSSVLLPVPPLAPSPLPSMSPKQSSILEPIYPSPGAHYSPPPSCLSSPNPWDFLSFSSPLYELAGSLGDLPSPFPSMTPPHPGPQAQSL